MTKKKQWIGMVSLFESSGWRDSYYIKNEYDHNSWDAEWVIDGPYRYYNTCCLDKLFVRKINHPEFYKKIKGGHFEDNSYRALFRITKMLNVE